MVHRVLIKFATVMYVSCISPTMFTILRKIKFAFIQMTTKYEMKCRHNFLKIKFRNINVCNVPMSYNCNRRTINPRMLMMMMMMMMMNDDEKQRFSEAAVRSAVHLCENTLSALVDDLIDDAVLQRWHENEIVKI